MHVLLEQPRFEQDALQRAKKDRILQYQEVYAFCLMPVPYA
jgi:hypothetical protein